MIQSFVFSLIVKVMTVSNLTKMIFVLYCTGLLYQYLLFMHKTIAMVFLLIKAIVMVNYKLEILWT